MRAADQHQLSSTCPPLVHKVSARRTHLGMRQGMCRAVHHNQHVLVWVLGCRPAQHRVDHRAQAQACSQAAAAGSRDNSARTSMPAAAAHPMRLVAAAIRTDSWQVGYLLPKHAPSGRKVTQLVGQFATASISSDWCSARLLSPPPAVCGSACRGESAQPTAAFTAARRLSQSCPAAGSCDALSGGGGGAAAQACRRAAAAALNRSKAWAAACAAGSLPAMAARLGCPPSALLGLCRCPRLLGGEPVSRSQSACDPQIVAEREDLLRRGQTPGRVKTWLWHQQGSNCRRSGVRCTADRRPCSACAVLQVADLSQMSRHVARQPAATRLLLPCDPHW